MPGIRVRDHENFEAAMRRFKRVVEKSGLLAEIRKRAFYESPSDKKKKALAAAVKRLRKKIQRERQGFEKDRVRSRSARVERLILPSSDQKTNGDASE